jgi:hypothetical protein
MTTEKRLIDADKLLSEIHHYDKVQKSDVWLTEDIEYLLKEQPTVDAVEVVHGRWVLTANEEQTNYRWNVTAECSECHHSKGEIWAGFFPGFPQQVAKDTALTCAESVKLDNYCPNCGAKMDGDGNG